MKSLKNLTWLERVNSTTEEYEQAKFNDMKEELKNGFSKEEILKQIIRGNEESLGWKVQHYSGAIAKMMYNQQYKSPNRGKKSR